MTASGVHGTRTPATLLWLAGTGLRLTILAVPPVLAMIRDDLALTATQVGLLSSIPSAMFVTAIGISAAYKAGFGRTLGLGVKRGVGLFGVSLALMATLVLPTLFFVIPGVILAVRFLLAVPVFVFAYLSAGRESWALTIVLTALSWLFMEGLFNRFLHLPFSEGWIFGLWP